jgi:hypothetical protein
MGARDERIDRYVEGSEPFARPILRHLRELVHATCPEVEETVKWGMPYFTYQGILCGMASFGQHCVFGFWQGQRIVGDDVGRPSEAMGQFGRIRSLDDLPGDEVIAGMIREAMRLNERGEAGRGGRKRRTGAEAELPPDLQQALEENDAARLTFERFPPSKRREYVEWVVEAKREETRQRRIRTAVEWLAEGRSRHWKHQKGS